MHLSRVAALVALLLLGACQSGSTGDFRPLVAWRSYAGTGLPSTWTISDNTITNATGGGGIVSEETFADFELTFEWQVQPGGNSGVMYRVSEDAANAAYTGPEYQILDNAGHADGKDPLTSAASVYSLFAPNADVTRPADAWNSARIIVQGNDVSHWLNGIEVVRYALGSGEWKARVAATGLSAYPRFATNRSGHIVLQDHGDSVVYRNMMIRSIP